jgi:hypothetical protein
VLGGMYTLACTGIRKMCKENSVAGPNASELSNRSLTRQSSLNSSFTLVSRVLCLCLRTRARAHACVRACLRLHCVHGLVGGRGKPSLYLLYFARRMTTMHRCTSSEFEHLLTTL